MLHLLPLLSVLLREQQSLWTVSLPLIALYFSADKFANVMMLTPFWKIGTPKPAAVWASP